ncbi:MAG TPA: hypothetical protein VK472_03520 [Allosphingosinicella sp.]|nr:hypothetical protein [Allosphingosinicella sp.]
MTAADRTAFERGLFSADPAGLYARLKRDFPADYEAMIRELLVQAKASGGSKPVMEQAGFRSIRAFYASRLSAIVNAPASVLNDFNARELNFVKKLAAQDLALCRTYVMTGFSAGTAVPGNLVVDMGQVGLGMIAAAKAGSGRPVDPQRGQIPSADMEPWFGKMRELDPSDEMRRFLTGDQSPAADPATGCRLGTALYQAIAALPSEQSARITAYLIASSINRSQ